MQHSFIILTVPFFKKKKKNDNETQQLFTLLLIQWQVATSAHRTSFLQTPPTAAPQLSKSSHFYFCTAKYTITQH